MLLRRPLFAIAGTKFKRCRALWRNPRDRLNGLDDCDFISGLV